MIGQLEFITTYTVETIKPDIYRSISVSVIGLLILVIYLVTRKLRYRQIEDEGLEFMFSPTFLGLAKSNLLRLSLIFFGIILNILAVGSFVGKKRQIEHFNDLLKSSKTEIAEGRINVLNRQPYDGHAPGDIIEIGKIRFHIDFFFESKLFYNRTIAHGGTLTEGKYVRVYFIPDDKKDMGEWKILKIEESYGR